jgi:hypothetical protein
LDKRDQSENQIKKHGTKVFWGVSASTPHLVSIANQETSVVPFVGSKKKMECNSRRTIYPLSKKKKKMLEEA